MTDTAQLRFVTLATRVRRWPGRRRRVLQNVERRWAGLFYGWITKIPGGRTVANMSAGISRKAELSSRPFEEQMKRLNLIHAARWFVISHLAARERRSVRRLMFFVSNFDREIPAYVEAFVDGFGQGGLATQWADAPGWPKNDATVAMLLDFALAHAVPTGYEFKAIRNASTNDVRSALNVERSVQAFVRETSHLDEADEYDRADFASRFYSLLDRLQPCLGRLTISGSWPELRDPSTLRSRRRGLLLLVPFRRERMSEVARSLDQLCNDDPELFGRVEQTHTARMGLFSSVFDKERACPRDLAHGYLLVSAEFHVVDAPPEEWWPGARRYVMSLLAETANTELWQPAMDFVDTNNTETFCDYLCRRRRVLPSRGPLYPPTMDFVDYPHVTPASAMAALETHRVFESFLSDQWDLDFADDPSAIKELRRLLESTRRTYV